MRPPSSNADWAINAIGNDLARVVAIDNHDTRETKLTLVVDVPAVTFGTVGGEYTVSVTPKAGKMHLLIGVEKWPEA